MKNTYVKSALLMIVASFFVVACGKFEDGPAFSLRTIKSRVTGEWVIESCTYNDSDVTAGMNTLLGANYVLEIEKDGGYRTEGAWPEEGAWELGEDGDDIRMTSNASGSTEISERILRLTSKEMWLRYTATNGDITITKYEAKD